MILDHLGLSARCDTGSPKSKLPLGLSEVSPTKSSHDKSWKKMNRVNHYASLLEVCAEQGVILDHLILSVRCGTGSPEFVSKV